MQRATRLVLWAFRGQITPAAALGAGPLSCNTCRFAETPQLRDSRANTEAMRTLGTMICYCVFPTRAEQLEEEHSQRQTGAKGDAESACYGTSSPARAATNLSNCRETKLDMEYKDRPKKNCVIASPNILLINVIQHHFLLATRLRVGIESHPSHTGRRTLSTQRPAQINILEKYAALKSNGSVPCAREDGERSQEHAYKRRQAKQNEAKARHETIR